MIHVLLVDDHAMVRQGLRMLFEVDKEFEIIGEAADGETAVSMALRLQPDVVVMDVRMPRMDGIAATTKICREAPDVKVVLISGNLEGSTLVDAVRAGAMSYVLKDASGDELRATIKAVAAGRTQMAYNVTQSLLHELYAPMTREALTDRERQVLGLMTKGESNREIAQALSISEKTVKTHVSSILAKFDASSRTQAVARAMQAGLIVGPRN